MPSPFSRSDVPPHSTSRMTLRLAAGATLALFAASACSSVELATVQADPRAAAISRQVDQAGADPESTVGPLDETPEPTPRPRRRPRPTPEATIAPLPGVAASAEPVARAE